MGNKPKYKVSIQQLHSDRGGMLESIGDLLAEDHVLPGEKIVIERLEE